MPLQFLKFWDLPLQFTYSQTCHYNSPSTWSLPFSMSFGCLGPLSGHCTRTHLPYGTKYPCFFSLHSLICGSHKSASPSTSNHTPPRLDCLTEPCPAASGGRPPSHLLSRRRQRAHVQPQRALPYSSLSPARSSWCTEPARAVEPGGPVACAPRGGRGAQRCSVGHASARGWPATSAPRWWHGDAPFPAARCLSPSTISGTPTWWSLHFKCLLMEYTFKKNS